MSDQIASTPLEGPTRYDFGAGTPETWPQGYYVPEADYDALAARLTESEQHRTKNRDTAVALQDEVTDLRMKLGFRDEENVHLVGEVERLEAALTAALRGASRTDAEASAQEREPK